MSHQRYFQEEDRSSKITEKERKSHGAKNSTRYVRTDKRMSPNTRLKSKALQLGRKKLEGRSF